MRWTVRGWRSVNGVAATQPMMTMTMEAAKTQKPTHDSSLRAPYMYPRFSRIPVVNTKVTCMTMKRRNQTITRKCRDRAA